MMNLRISLLFTVLLLLAFVTMGRSAGTNSSGEILDRYALVFSSNDGGRERIVLRYADSDARNFAEVLYKFGGVSGENLYLVQDADRHSLDSAFRVLEAALNESKSKRREVILYYSGHADAAGLLINGKRYDYRKLRARMENLNADVRIAVLDACESGAFIRYKGGKIARPFLVDESSNMKGYAILTSSSKNEVSQESDKIGGSYFTHSLVSGMRGAADVSGDSRVTLGEAYQFAFHQTLAHTTHGQGGSQHPNYEMNLSGTGDVVMTDLSQTTSTLILDKNIEGHFFIRDTQGKLVAELSKQPGRPLGLALEPGIYTVEKESHTLQSAQFNLTDGQSYTLYAHAFQVQSREFTLARGGTHVPDTALLQQTQTQQVPPRVPAVPETVFVDTSKRSAKELRKEACSEASKGRFEVGNIITSDAGDNFCGVQLAVVSAASGKNMYGVSISPVINQSKGPIYGVQLGSVIAMAENDVKGVQISSIFSSAGEVDGVQVSGSVGLSKGLDGVQVTGIWAHSDSGSMDGVQVSGVGASVLDADTFEGVQIAGGFAYLDAPGEGVQVAGAYAQSRQRRDGIQIAGGFNVADTLDGVMIAGGGNKVDSISGVQVSGAVNIANKMKGVQVVGAVNIADTLDGVQVGVVNLARKVKGVQVGVINVADTIKGISIGVLNLNKSGILALGMGTDENLLTNISFRSGQHFFYTHLHYYQEVKEDLNRAFDKTTLGFGAGLGGRFGKNAVFGELEWESAFFWDELSDWGHGRGYHGLNNINRIRLGAGLRLGRHVDFVASTTSNFLIMDRGAPYNEVLLRGADNSWNSWGHQPTSSTRNEEQIHSNGTKMRFWQGFQLRMDIGLI